MKQQRGYITLIEVFIVLAIIGVLAVAIISPPLTCEAQAAEMGKPHKFGWMSGCMIEHKPGQWIPIKQYRVID